MPTSYLYATQHNSSHCNYCAAESPVKSIDEAILHKSKPCVELFCMHLLTSETAIRVCKLPSCPFVYKQLLRPMRFLCIADWTTRANHHVQSMAGNIQRDCCLFPVEKNLCILFRNWYVKQFEAHSLQTHWLVRLSMCYTDWKSCLYQLLHKQYLLTYKEKWFDLSFSVVIQNFFNSHLSVCV